MRATVWADGGTRQHQAHSEVNSSLHYLSPNGAHVKPEIVKSNVFALNVPDLLLTDSPHAFSLETRGLPGRLDRHSEADSLRPTEVLNRIPFESQEVCFVTIFPPMNTRLSG
jgi:hypothetical protein